MVHAPHAIKSVMMVSFRRVFGARCFDADPPLCVIVMRDCKVWRYPKGVDLGKEREPD